MCECEGAWAYGRDGTMNEVGDRRGGTGGADLTEVSSSARPKSSATCEKT